jgi:hypothetical protein
MNNFSRENSRFGGRILPCSREDASLGMVNQGISYESFHHPTNRISTACDCIFSISGKR